MKNPKLTESFEFDKQYIKKRLSNHIKHDYGLFILAPSGVGKTTFVNNQVTKNWIDGDYIWPLSGADPLGDGWENSIEDVIAVNKRSDTVTKWAIENGFWIIGSSNDSLMPDAIVLPDWKEHKKRITHREQTNYDGGAKAENFDDVKSHRKWIEKWEQKGVPRFTEIEDAVNYLTNKIMLISIEPERDGKLAAGWINGPGGAQMLQLMGMLVPDDFTTTVDIETKRSYEIKNNKNELAWMISYKNNVVGIVEVHIKEFEGLKSPSISIMIGDASIRGKGLGTKVLSIVITKLNNMNYEVVYARALTHNIASIKMLNKVGFENDSKPYKDKEGLNWQNAKYKIT